MRGFKGIPHTFEKLGLVRGVTFFNDSKATTLESVDAALRSFETPVILILGGRLKAGSFTSLRDAVAKHAFSVHAIGESRALIHQALDDVRPVQPQVPRVEPLAVDGDDELRRVGVHGQGQPGHAEAVCLRLASTPRSG